MRRPFIRFRTTSAEAGETDATNAAGGGGEGGKGERRKEGKEEIILQIYGSIAFRNTYIFLLNAL